MGIAQTPLVQRWAESGAMALTGRADGPPLCPPADLVDRIVRLGERAGADGLAALAERAAFSELSRQGDRSCGGTSRLLRTPDGGWVAVTLARDDDVDLVPAWLELADGDAWYAVERAFANGSGAALVERGRMLGLPVAMVGSVGAPRPDGASSFCDRDVVPEHHPPPDPALPPYAATASPPLSRRGWVTEQDWEPPAELADLPVVATRFPRARRRATRSTPLVVDLSSLWAGPLCARLLGEAGADVVKVEAVHRPDGARRGPVGFFDLFHGGHRAVALDFRSPEGVEALGRLLRAADVVIEASRPRALAQLGLAAEDVLAAGDGPAVWVSITGYGRTGPGRDWVAFGDDAAAAGGLVAWDNAGPCFFADAAADPLSGLAAAAATRALLAAGGTWLVDVAMADVAAWVAGPTVPTNDRSVYWMCPNLGTSSTQNGRGLGALGARRRGPLLGEHTDEVLAWLGQQR